MIQVAFSLIFCLSYNVVLKDAFVTDILSMLDYFFNY